jgi:hypothetical protein
MIIFHLLSIYLCVEDFKKCRVNIIAYGFCLLSLILEIWARRIPLETFTGIILFLSTISVLMFFYKRPVIAFADVIYALFCLWIVGDKYYLYFICIGIFSIIFHLLKTGSIGVYKKSHPNVEDQRIPFLPVLYGAFLICYYF